MSEAPVSIVIPSDLPACQALIEQQAITIKELQQAKEELHLKLAEALQLAYRNRRERYVEDPNQLNLDFGNTDDAADAAEGLSEALEESEQTIPEHRRRKAKKVRNEQLPAHLPRYEVEAKASDEVRNCPTHGERKLIGFDTTETLEFARPKLRVRVTKHPKFACEGCEECGVTSPPRARGLVEGNRYDTSVAAEIITGKYGYHCVQGKAA